MTFFVRAPGQGLVFCMNNFIFSIDKTLEIKTETAPAFWVQVVQADNVLSCFSTLYNSRLLFFYGQSKKQIKVAVKKCAAVQIYLAIICALIKLCNNLCWCWSLSILWFRRKIQHLTNEKDTSSFRKAFLLMKTLFLNPIKLEKEYFLNYFNSMVWIFFEKQLVAKTIEEITNA